jgi:hypothetical protein
MGWPVRGLNPSWSEIVRSRQDRPWSPPSHLQNGYRVSFPGVKHLWHDVQHQPSPSAKVKERVELSLSSHSGPSWSVLGRYLLFYAIFSIPYKEYYLQYICMFEYPEALTFRIPKGLLRPVAGKKYIGLYTL